MADNWYYSQDGKSKIGPITFTALQQVAASGVLHPTHMVIQEGTTQWKQAKSIPGLFPGTTVQSSAQPPSAIPIQHSPQKSVADTIQAMAKDLWGKFLALPTRIRYAVIGGGAAGVILFSCLCCGVFGLIGGGGGNGGTDSKGNPDGATLTARELLLAYTANEKEADRKYNGKVLELTGVVQDQGPSNVYLGILLEGGTDIRMTLVAEFGKNKHVWEELAELRKQNRLKGATVLVKGTCDNRIVDFGYMHLSNCTSLQVLPGNHSASAELEKKTGTKTTARELTLAYLTNKTNADTKFNSKVLEVQGVVKFMDVPAVGLAAIGLEGTNNKISVRCYFGVDRHKALDKLRDQVTQGATVTIKGICNGGPRGVEGNEFIQLDNCVMVDPPFKK